MLTLRQSGSRGTETSSQRFGAARHLGDRVLGSGTCSSTSIARRHARTRRRRRACSRPSSRGTRGSAPGALSHARAAAGRRGRCRRCARAELLRPLVREHALAAADVEDRARRGLVEQLVEARWKPAIRRRTTGFVEPYLSNVLPVTVPSRSTVTLVLTAGSPPAPRGLALLLGRRRGVGAGRRGACARAGARRARSATAGPRAAARSAARARRRAGA